MQTKRGLTPFFIYKTDASPLPSSTMFGPFHLFSPTPFFLAISLSFSPQRHANQVGYSVHSEVQPIYSVLCLSVFKLAFFRRVVRFRRRPVGLGGRLTFSFRASSQFPSPTSFFSPPPFSIEANSASHQRGRFSGEEHGGRRRWYTPLRVESSVSLFYPL